MRAILLIALALCGCACDSDVAATDLALADMRVVGEFCGTGGDRCCTTELEGEPCTTGDTCRYNSRCGGSLTCPAGSWIRNSFSCADLWSAPRD